MNNTKHNPWAEITRLRAENARLTAELEAARKVADAAVRYCEFKGDVGDQLRASHTLAVAVIEYRAAKPLSPSKQAAVERGLDRADKLQTMQEMN